MITLLEKKFWIPYLYTMAYEPATYLFLSYTILWNTLPSVKEMPPVLAWLIPVAGLVFYILKEREVLKTKKIERARMEQENMFIDIALEKYKSGLIDEKMMDEIFDKYKK